MTDVAPISEGRVRLRAETLYAPLNRLPLGAWSRSTGEEVADTRPRRYHRLTPPGVQRPMAPVLCG